MVREQAIFPIKRLDGLSDPERPASAARPTSVAAFELLLVAYLHSTSTTTNSSSSVSTGRWAE